MLHKSAFILAAKQRHVSFTVALQIRMRSTAAIQAPQTLQPELGKLCERSATS